MKKVIPPGQKVQDGEEASLAKKLRMVGFSQSADDSKQQLGQGVSESISTNHRD